jgi:hypothetical protein
MVLGFAAVQFPGKTFVIHLDNASYHKASQPGIFNPRTAQGMDIIFEICNRCTNFGFVPEDFMTPAGNPIGRRRLVELYREFVEPPPKAIAQLALEFGARVLFTPPYWPEVQPVEKFNNNLKGDYRDRDPDERGPNVGAAVQDFCVCVAESDVKGWVEHTDKFCRAVYERDDDVLTPLELGLLPDA